MSLPRTSATRFVTPLREGGSMPGVMEGADNGTWVVKFRGAGQGLKVLVAEVIVTELARRLGVRVPELREIDVPAPIARYEADEEVQDLLDASLGSNLAIDLLPGAFGYDGATTPPADEAAMIIWLDAFTANVDRTDHNPNLLVWHANTWAIDHGAALYFHHSWPRRAPNPDRFAAQPFDASSHVLRSIPGQADLDDAHRRAVELLNPQTLRAVIDEGPEAWLETTEQLTSTDQVRRAYLDHLTARLSNAGAWLPTAHPSAAGAR